MGGGGSKLNTTYIPLVGRCFLVKSVLSGERGGAAANTFSEILGGVSWVGGGEEKTEMNYQIKYGVINSITVP